MSSAEPLSTQPEDELVFLVGLQTDEIDRREAEASLEELHRLAGSTPARIVGSMLVNVRHPDPGTFLSSGLIESVRQAVESAGAGTVVLDDDVSPVQQRNLENRWNVKLLTRSELILDIFAQSARTHEGKLQVELAQYQYRLPRLRGRGTALSRLGGGIGTRGPGEMKLEVDRRVISRRIHTLEQRIAKVKQNRDIQRSRRQSAQIPVIALVGYTNAGKSTLLNALTGADALVENKLFATLDPTTRSARLPSGMEVLYVDTVGFISRLPTQLAAAFRATLEEVLYADVLVHVVDVTSHRRNREFEVTRSVLRDLGAGTTPVVTAWNKTDLLDGAAFDPESIAPPRQRPTDSAAPGDAAADAEPEPVDESAVDLQGPRPLPAPLAAPSAAGRFEPSVQISAATGAGLDRLQLEIQRLIDSSRPQSWLRFGYNEYGEINRIEKATTVHQLHHLEDGIYLLASLTPELHQRYESHVTEPPAPERLAAAGAPSGGK